MIDGRHVSCPNAPGHLAVDYDDIWRECLIYWIKNLVVLCIGSLDCRKLIADERDNHGASELSVVFRRRCVVDFGYVRHLRRRYMCDSMTVTVTLIPWLVSPSWARGTSFPPSFIHFLIFCSVLLFPFSFSHSLCLFSSFVTSIPFYQNSPTLFPGRGL